MKKKILISMLLMNLSVGIIVANSYNYFQKSTSAYKENTVLVSLDGNLYNYGNEKNDFAFTKDMQKKIQDLSGVKSAEFVSGRSGMAYIAGQKPEERVQYSGKNATNMTKDYANLKYVKGHEIKNDNEMVISEKLAKKFTSDPIGKSMIVGEETAKKKVIVGVYENDAFNPASGDTQFYSRNLDDYDTDLTKAEEYGITSQVNDRLGKKYSQEELISIYGESLRDEVYVELDDTMPTAKFEKNISGLLKGEKIYSNSYSISDLKSYNLVVVLILANITGVVLILKLYFREKKQK